MFPFRVSVSVSLSKRGLGMAVGDGLSWRHQPNPVSSEGKGVEAAWPRRCCPIVVCFAAAGVVGPCRKWGKGDLSLPARNSPKATALLPPPRSHGRAPGRSGQGCLRPSSRHPAGRPHGFQGPHPGPAGPGPSRAARRTPWAPRVGAAGGSRPGGRSRGSSRTQATAPWRACAARRTC